MAKILPYKAFIVLQIPMKNIPKCVSTLAFRHTDPTIPLYTKLTQTPSSSSLPLELLGSTKRLNVNYQDVDGYVIKQRQKYL